MLLRKNVGKQATKKLHVNTWKNLFINFKETKLIQMQWKILHNIYPTNILLQKIGVKNTPICDFCEERDVVEHFFFKCERLHGFWENISKNIDNKLNKKITLNETTVLFGIEQVHQNLSPKEQKYINTIFALGKLSIIKNKSLKFKIDILFEREVSLRNIEL